MIFDLGASRCRVGLSDDETPRSKFKSCIGVNAASDHVSFGDNCKDTEVLFWPFQAGCVGNKSDWPSHIEGISLPSQESLIEDWFTYSVMCELREDATEYGCLLVANEPEWSGENLLSGTSSAMKVIMADTLLNKLEYQSVTFVPNSVLTLAGIEEPRGVVIDIGASGFRINVVSENRLLGAVSGKVGGNTLIEHIMKSQSLSNAKAEAWLLENGSVQAQTSDSVGEILFSQGKLVEKLVELVRSLSIEVSDYAFVLTGGVSNLKGLSQRIQSDIKRDLGIEVRFIHVENAVKTVFQGAYSVCQRGSLEAATSGNYENLDGKF